jgi:hypothetical protein
LQHSTSETQVDPSPWHVVAAKLQRRVVGLQLPLQQVTASSVPMQFSPEFWQRSWSFPTKRQSRVPGSQLFEQQSALTAHAPPCERQRAPQMPLKQPSEQH